LQQPKTGNTKIRKSSFSKNQLTFRELSGQMLDRFEKLNRILILKMGT